MSYKNVDREGNNVRVTAMTLFQEESSARFRGKKHRCFAGKLYQRTIIGIFA
jgi:hypothetical protein